MKRIFLICTLLFVSAGLTGTGAMAQSYLNPNASAAQVKRALQGTRSIRPSPAPRASTPRRHRSAARSGSRSGAVGRSVGGAAAAAAVAAAPLPASEGDPDAGPASFRIQFALGSADLRRETIPLLDKLGEALTSDDLDDWAFVVEGHTDASGDELFNQQLSLRRAEAVRDYLVSKHGVDPTRLPVQGYGESRPYDADRPEAAINRRVTFSAPEPAPPGPEPLPGVAADAVAISAGLPTPEADGGAADRPEGRSTIIETGPAPAGSADSQVPASESDAPVPAVDVQRAVDPA